MAPVDGLQHCTARTQSRTRRNAPSPTSASRGEADRARSARTTAAQCAIRATRRPHDRDEAPRRQTGRPSEGTRNARKDPAL